VPATSLAPPSPSAAPAAQVCPELHSSGRHSMSAAPLSVRVQRARRLSINRQARKLPLSLSHLHTSGGYNARKWRAVMSLTLDAIAVGLPSRDFDFGFGNGSQSSRRWRVIPPSTASASGWMLDLLYPSGPASASCCRSWEGLPLRVRTRAVEVVATVAGINVYVYADSYVYAGRDHSEEDRRRAARARVDAR
jgi:hypothetical protein